MRLARRKQSHISISTRSPTAPRSFVSPGHHAEARQPTLARSPRPQQGSVRPPLIRPKSALALITCVGANPTASQAAELRSI